MLLTVMSSRDEMAVVVKCLRLGAADYLVKPLRTNELLNLWTHMWRRRRMVRICLDITCRTTFLKCNGLSRFVLSSRVHDGEF